MKFQNEAKIAQEEKKLADNSLQKTKDELQSTEVKVAEKQAVLSNMLAQIEYIATLSAASPSCPELKKVDDALGRADIDLRAFVPAAPIAATDRSVGQIIEQLFGNTASVRGHAYESIMASFSKDPTLVPKLIAHATANPTNLNGIYNALVVLSHLDHRALGSDLQAIRAFAASVESKGPKIAERVQKLLERLPK